MTRPKSGPPKVQLTAYVRADLKAKLAARAAETGKRERDLVEAALERHLDPEPASPEEPAPKPA